LTVNTVNGSAHTENSRASDHAEIAKPNGIALFSNVLFFCSSLGECRILVEQGEGQMKNCKFAL
jgi:hypothetical protein